MQLAQHTNQRRIVMPLKSIVSADLPVQLKTANYSILASDVGTEVQFESASAVTADLLPVNEAGNGYNIVLRNVGAGDLTIDPAGSELIDGSSTVILSAGDWRWIRSDGTAWKSISVNSGGGGTGGLVSIQSFTSSGTWTKPAGVNLIQIWCVGGGGGSGSCGATGSGQICATGGGGGGGAAMKLLDVTAIGTRTVTIGSGGSGGASGGVNSGTGGGTTTFGSDCAASGGTGNAGQSGTSTVKTLGGSGFGGAGQTGDILLEGSPGGAGYSFGASASAGNGGSGASMFGGGGGLGHNVSTANPPIGNNGGDYGGGASGRAVGQNQASTSGLDGADGICVVYEYA